MGTPERNVHKIMGLKSMQLDLAESAALSPGSRASSLILRLWALSFRVLSPFTRSFSNLPTVSPVRKVDVR